MAPLAAHAGLANFESEQSKSNWKRKSSLRTFIITFSQRETDGSSVAVPSEYRKNNAAPVGSEQRKEFSPDTSLNGPAFLKTLPPGSCPELAEWRYGPLLTTPGEEGAPRAVDGGSKQSYSTMLTQWNDNAYICFRRIEDSPTKGWTSKPLSNKTINRISSSRIGSSNIHNTTETNGRDLLTPLTLSKFSKTTCQTLQCPTCGTSTSLGGWTK